MGNVNFGIDLGTTNSGIAKYTNGQVTIFKNPVGFKDTLPSVVAFRNEKIQVGDKARERIVTTPQYVFSAFKRKMGTDETYSITGTEKQVTPIDLSAYVLRELIGFVPDESIGSAVITIPASFDTIQSNATKKSGYEAGLEEVVLLQEPIAACLAYSNIQNLTIEKDEKWLVYDYGGGTFDVALVNINHRELKTIDHKGNNFLGGVDLDNLMVEKIICEKLEEKGYEGVWKKMTETDDVKYKKLYYELLFKAEEAKKELSLKETSAIEIDNDDLNLHLDIEINREQFNEVVKPNFDLSFELLKKLLVNNNLKFENIDRIILVGGSTYIPYIRKELAERTNIEVDTNIDPTTAVMVGAAYFAGNKPSKIKAKEVVKEEVVVSNSVDVKWIYDPYTQDLEELITGVFKESFSGFYRITRADGGFDSGLKSCQNKVSEFVTLLPKAVNQFTITVFNKRKKQIAQFNDVKITNGLYNVSGQPLPNDICIELDDSDGKTFLETIFKKNEILPLKKALYKTSSKTILKNSDNKLIINIVEGNAGNIPASNLTIGYIEISGENFQYDLLKGMEIELGFEITESRDLHVNVYISSLDLEIEEMFTPHKRTVSAEKLLNEVKFAIDDVQHEISEEEYNENYEYLIKLREIKTTLEGIYEEVKIILHDITTERKYQLDDRKRKTLADFDDLIRHKHIIQEIKEYKNLKERVEYYLEDANEKQKTAFIKITGKEKEILESGNKYLIKGKSKELNKLLDNLFENRDEIYYHWFYTLKAKDESEFKNVKSYYKLIDSGDDAIEKGNIKVLRIICNQLYNLLINPPNEDDEEYFEGNIGLQ